MKSYSKLYLDSGIFVALFDKNDYDRKKKINRHKLIMQTFKERLPESNLKLYTSAWCFVEVAKVLVKDKGLSESKVDRWISDLLLKSKIEGIKFEIVKFNEKYSIEELFLDIRKNLLLTKEKISIGDIINVICMKKHRIKTILTFDEKEYRLIPKIAQMTPYDLKATFDKIK